MNTILNLKLFDGAGAVVNTTGGYTDVNTGAQEPFSGVYTLSPGMKDFYKTEMLENSRPQQYFAQFAEKLPLPRNNGMTLERRKWNVLPPAMKAIVEGINPKGERLGQSVVRTTIHQYGAYVEISDQLELHHVDNVMLGASEELGAQHGQTEDLLVRNVLSTGTNLMFCDVLDDAGKYVSTPVTRWQMTGKEKFTADTCARIRTKMIKEKVPKIGNWYVGVMHPSVSEDFMADNAHNGWNEVHKYAAVENIFNGEIGEMKGIRFVETTNAPVYVGGPLLNDDQRYLTVTGYEKLGDAAVATVGDGTMYQVTVSEALTAEIAEKLIGRYVLIEKGGEIAEQMKIMGVSYATKHLYVDEEPVNAPASGDYLTPGEGGAEKHDGEQIAVYGTFILGKNAYAIIDPEGDGFEMIAHDKRIAGGALELKSTIGWKMSQGVLLQYPERILRVESTGRYSGVDVDVLDEDVA